jgi:hypothetical protein
MERRALHNTAVPRFDAIVSAVIPGLRLNNNTRNPTGMSQLRIAIEDYSITIRVDLGLTQSEKG